MQLRISLKLSDLSIGFIAKRNYYDRDGVLVLPKNTELTQRMLETLKKKNLTYLYIDELEDKEGDLSVSTSSTNYSLLFSNPIIEQYNILNSNIEELLKVPEIKKIDDLLFKLKLKVDRIGVSLKNILAKKNKKLLLVEEPKHKKAREIYTQVLATLKEEIKRIAEGKKYNVLALHDIIITLNSILQESEELFFILSGFRGKNLDNYLLEHVLNVAIISMVIAFEAGFNANQIIEIGITALVSDIGMFFVPQEIIYKDNSLENSEIEIIKKHPISSAIITDKLSNLSDNIKVSAFQIHERIDGSGYPQGRKDKYIHEYAKIIQIADMYVALTSDRPYRKAYTPFRAIKMLAELSVKGQISKKYFKIFLKRFSILPIGTYVELSTGELAQIIAINNKDFLKPVVKKLNDNKVINLLTSDITVKSILAYSEVK